MNESLDSRQLKAFVILAQTGSYTETAKQLYVTHSAICHSMRALEEQVGCRLLSKLSKKAILTEAGEALLTHAHRALNEMRQARQTLANLNQWGTRRLRLAADTTFLSTFLTPVLLQFHKDFPNARLQIESCGGENPANLLENNRADIILAEKPPADETTEFIPLIADRFHLVINSDHPLAAQKSPSREGLAKNPCLLLRGSTHGRKQLEEFLSRREITLNIIGEIESVDALKDFVKHTPAMCLLPGWAVAVELTDRSFTALPLGRAPFELTWGFIHSRARPLNHAESTLLKLCRKRVAELA
jgi:DNA-binding transcriptional LysR family regulator